MSIQDKLVLALRADPARKWTPAGLAKAIETTQPETIKALQSLRWAGKVRFDRIALTPSMLEDAAANAPSGAGLVDRPTGPVLFGELESFLKSKQIDVAAFCQATGFPIATVSSVKRASRPKPATVERLRRAIREYPKRQPDFAPIPVRGMAALDSARERTQAVAALPVVAPIVPAAPAEPMLRNYRLADRKITGGADNNFRFKVDPQEVIDQPSPLLSIQEQVAQEAERAGARRRIAGSLSKDAGNLSPETLVEQVTTIFAETAPDAMQAVSRRWPSLWGRILHRSRESQKRPGVLFAEVIEAGLRSLEQDAA